MIKFEKKKILIYGFGLTGKSCFNFLKKKNFVKIYDDESQKINKKYKSFFLKKKSLANYKFDNIVLSPGIDLNKCSIKEYLKKNNKIIISDLDIFYFKFIKNLKITITGTNGKSTTAKLIYDILKDNKNDVRLVGNIGFPILNEKQINNNTIFVIEASSYQIEYSGFFKTDIAILLNITPDHLERHKSFKNYIKVKLKLIKNQNKNGIAIVNLSDKFLRKQIYLNGLQKKIVRMNLKLPNKILKNIKNSYFQNLNNIENLKYAYAVSKILKVSDKNILKNINKFSGLIYRNEIIFNNGRLMIINDSKSTSFSSSVSLLQSFKNIYWIIGGMAKKGDEFKLKKKFSKNIKAYIYGKDIDFFEKKIKNKIKLKTYKNLIDALKDVYRDCILDKKKKNIIFSPAAASFDQFQNFEKRGKYFNFLINKIGFKKI